MNFLPKDYQSSVSDTTFSWHILLNDVSGVKNIFNGDVHTEDQFSFLMNLTSCCSEQMDVPKSCDIIMNVMSPIVFWNMIILVMVVSWCGQGFTLMVLVRVNGMLTAQIY